MSNELHTMPLKVEKLLSSQRFRRMRWDEKGAYMLLLAEAWLDGARLENNPDGIRELLGVSDDTDWGRIKKFVLDRMFAPSEDGNWLVNSTQAEIFQETITRHDVLSESGKRGNEKRWGGDRVAIGGRCLGDRIQSQSQKQSQKQRESEDAPAQNEFVEYPKTWEEVQKEAENIGYPMPQADAENFLGKWQAKGWKDGKSPILDWRRLLTTWKNNAGKFDEKKSGKFAVGQKHDQKIREWKSKL